ncbi:MAG: PCRF domain-containing protein, partial [Candidatus Shikimatogenerans sp. JK-2022]|nr:PCRF domain-containing protein [Candidatus Shikimatogenerans bostrichidophilus]
NLLLEIKNNINIIKYKLKIIKSKINKNINKIEKLKKKKFNINEAFLEIRSGTGGNESNIFVKDIFRMYIMYFKKKNIIYKILNINKTKIGFKEIIIFIKKKNIYNKLKFESGIHRVQRIPKTETQGRLHTSAITVAVLPKINDNNINIKLSDIKRSTFKSSGAGGQHVNKTESAVRLIHKPTNIIVECQEERSQHKNYNKAITILKSKIYEYNIQKKKKYIVNKRKLLISTGDRSNKIRTYNYPQNRVTDHRIKLKLYNLDKIMNGEIDKLIDKLYIKLNTKNY